jgi:hypothetical protein
MYGMTGPPAKKIVPAILLGNEPRPRNCRFRYLFRLRKALSKAVNWLAPCVVSNRTAVCDRAKRNFLRKQVLKLEGPTLVAEKHEMPAILQPPMRVMKTPKAMFTMKSGDRGMDCGRRWHLSEKDCRTCMRSSRFSSDKQTPNQCRNLAS